MQVSESTSVHIKREIHADLDPRNSVAVLKIGAALMLGGGGSLFLCGQFGLGLTEVAHEFNHRIHHTLGPLGCAALCGALFSVVPVVALRLLCRPIEFRALLRRKWPPEIFWLGVMGGLFTYHGRFGFEWLTFWVWSLAAVTVFRALGRWLDRGRLQSPLPMGP